jgi:hypothetical protein
MLEAYDYATTCWIWSLTDAGSQCQKGTAGIRKKEHVANSNESCHASFFAEMSMKRPHFNARGLAICQRDNNNAKKICPDRNLDLSSLLLNRQYFSYEVEFILGYGCG